MSKLGKVILNRDSNNIDSGACKAIKSIEESREPCFYTQMQIAGSLMAFQASSAILVLSYLSKLAILQSSFKI